MNSSISSSFMAFAENIVERHHYFEYKAGIKRSVDSKSFVESQFEGDFLIASRVSLDMKEFSQAENAASPGENRNTDKWTLMTLAFMSSGYQDIIKKGKSQ